MHHVLALFVAERTSSSAGICVTRWSPATGSRGSSQPELEQSGPRIPEPPGVRGGAWMDGRPLHEAEALELLLHRGLLNLVAEFAGREVEQRSTATPVTLTRLPCLRLHRSVLKRARSTGMPRVRNEGVNVKLAETARGGPIRMAGDSCHAFARLKGGTCANRHMEHGRQRSWRR